MDNEPIFAMSMYANKADLFKAKAEHFENMSERLRKAICIYCREELGNMNWESDSDAIEYMLSFGDKA